TSATGAVYGVYGSTASTSSGAVGIYGVDASGDPGYTSALGVGVRGASSSGSGVIGVSKSLRGVLGLHQDSTGATTSFGELGTPTEGVSYFGGLAGTGTKSFVEPHPTDASKLIRYVSLEGPEAGTYFRGRGRFQR